VIFFQTLRIGEATLLIFRQFLSIYSAIVRLMNTCKRKQTIIATANNNFAIFSNFYKSRQDIYCKFINIFPTITGWCVVLSWTNNKKQVFENLNVVGENIQKVVYGCRSETFRECSRKIKHHPTPREKKARPNKCSIVLRNKGEEFACHFFWLTMTRANEIWNKSLNTK
jgi:hypothetical protein